MENKTNTKTIDALNELLRGELAAVETYAQAMDASLEKDAATQRDLETCRSSHQKRAARLKSAIAQMGGQPSKESGVWGAFAKVVEGGAKVMGAKMAVSALEQGEDYGVREYRNSLEKLDPVARHIVSTELIPAQSETHSTLSMLKRRLEA